MSRSFRSRFDHAGGDLVRRGIYPGYIENLKRWKGADANQPLRIAYG